MKLKQTNKWKTTGLIYGITIALGLITTVKADTIYRETFGGPSGGNNSLNGWGWQGFTNNGFAIGGLVTDAGDGVGLSSTGRLATVANTISAGPNMDLTYTAYPHGFVYAVSNITTAPGGGKQLIMTSEYTVNPADYEAGTLEFSWYQTTTHGVRLALNVGGSWYAGATAFTSVAGSGSTFKDVAQLKTVTFDPTAVNWLTLNFDGAYDGVTATDSTLGTMGLGAAPGSDLLGNITGFGWYIDAMNSTVRLDTFEVNATPVPEPTTATLFGLGTVALMAVWQRKRQVC